MQTRRGLPGWFAGASTGLAHKASRGGAQHQGEKDTLSLSQKRCCIRSFGLILSTSPCHASVGLFS